MLKVELAALVLGAMICGPAKANDPPPMCRAIFEDVSARLLSAGAMPEQKRFRLLGASYGALSAIYIDCRGDFQYLVGYLKTAKLYAIMLRSRRDTIFPDVIKHTVARGQQSVDEISQDPALTEAERARRCEKIKVFVSDLQALTGAHR